MSRFPRGGKRFPDKSIGGGRSRQKGREGMKFRKGKRAFQEKGEENGGRRGTVFYRRGERKNDWKKKRRTRSG